MAKYREKPKPPPELHAKQFLTLDNLPDGVRPFYPTPSMVKKDCVKCGHDLKEHGQLVVEETARILCPGMWAVRIGNKKWDVLTDEVFKERFDFDHPVREKKGEGADTAFSKE